MGDSDLDRLQIVGKVLVGSLIYVCGKMPEGTNRCWFQWERLRNGSPASISEGVLVKWEKISGENTPQYTPVDEDAGCELRVLLAPILDSRTLGKIVAVPAGKVLSPSVKLTDDHNSKEKVRHALAYAMQQRNDSVSVPITVSGEGVQESAQQHAPAVFRSVGQKETADDKPARFSRAEEEAQERARQGLASLMMQRPSVTQLSPAAGASIKAGVPATSRENTTGSFIKPALRPVDARVDPAAAKAAASAAGQVPVTSLRPTSGKENNNANTATSVNPQSAVANASILRSTSDSTAGSTGIARSTSGSGGGGVGNVVTALKPAVAAASTSSNQDATPGSFIRPILRPVDARVDPAAARAAASASGQLQGNATAAAAAPAAVAATTAPQNPSAGAGITRSTSGSGSGNVVGGIARSGSGGGAGGGTGVVPKPPVVVAASTSSTQDAPSGSFIKPALRPVDARVDPAAAKAAASAAGQVPAKSALASNAGAPASAGSATDAKYGTNASINADNAKSAPSAARPTSGLADAGGGSRSQGADVAAIAAAFSREAPKTSRPRIPETLVPSMPPRPKAEVMLVGSEDVDPWNDGDFLDSEAVGIPSKRFTTLRVPRP